MLSTAYFVAGLQRVEQDAPIGELIAYCVRETFDSVLRAAAPVPEVPWAGLSREVVEERRRYALADDLSPEAMQPLLASIDRLGAFHEGQASKAERQLLQLLQSRLGAEALRLPPDPVEEFVRLRRRANDLHGSVTVDDGGALLNDAVALLGRLFPEPEDRLQELDLLAAIESPGRDDLDRLFAAAIAPQHLTYFFEHARSVSWLEMAIADGLLLPGQMAGWPPLALVRRLRGDEAQRLEATLQAILNRHDGTPMTPFYLAQAGAELGRTGHPLLLRVLEAHPDNDSVRAFVGRAASEVGDDDPFIDAIGLWFLNPTRNHRGTADRFLDRFVRGATPANVLGRFDLALGCLTGQVAADAVGRFVLMSHSTVRGVHASDWDDESLPLAAVDQLMRRALEEGVPTADLLGRIGSLPTELRSAYRAIALSDGPDVDGQQVLDEIVAAVSSRHPQGDDIALIERWASSGLGDCSGSLTDALGEPPSAPEIGAALADRSLDENVMRAWLWASLLPTEVTAKWRTAVEVIASEYGRRTPESFRRHSHLGGPVHGSSPISTDELSGMAVLDAADLVRGWRPEPGGFLVTPRELAEALGAAIAENPEAWSKDLPIVVARLHHPTYITQLFERLTKAAAEVKASAALVVESVALVMSKPWNVEKLGGNDRWDYEPNWNQTIEAGMALIGALARADADFEAPGSEAWRLVLDAANTPDDGSRWSERGVDESLTVAINRPQTKALEIVFAMMGWEIRRGEAILAAPLDLLEAALRREGSDGAQHRAIIVTRLEFLASVAPDWLEAQRGLLLGDKCPAGLAEATVDLALHWSSRASWLLTNYRKEVMKSVFRGTEHALDHVLAAMCTGLAGYEPKAIVDRFFSEGDQWVSETGKTLSRVLGDAPQDHPATRVGVDYWRQVLEQANRTDQLRGFGWMAGVKALGQDEWLSLMRVTCEKAGGELEFPTSIADRVGRMSLSDDSAATLLLLMRGTREPWELSYMGEIAIRLLRLPDQPPEPIRSELRTALVEYGFVEARDL